MGISDRDYMRPGYRRRRGGTRVPWYRKLLFYVWRLFRSGGPRR
jgi:hypothetical protein